MSGKAVRETLGFLAVVASMVFVGLEIRQNTLQAQAAAYQEIGHQSAEWYRSRLDDRHLLALQVDAKHRPENLINWSELDWFASLYHHLDTVRLW